MKAPHSRWFPIALGWIMLVSSTSQAQVALRSAPAPRYQQIKTWHEQQWALATTPSEKMEVLRQTVRQGRHSGDRRLFNQFKNFGGDFAFDTDLPGLRQSILYLASDNRNVAMGAARTLRYAGVINGDARFEFTGLNRVIENAAGKTDADLLFRHKQTGKSVRIEVKEWSPQAQRANLRRAETQFRKMAEDRRVTGRLQAWVNRRGNTPRIESLGKKYGIPVYANVATGKTAYKPGQMTLAKVLNDTDRRATFFPRTISGGLELGLGAYQLWVAGPEMWNELELLLDPDRADQASRARLGQQGSLALGGGLLTMSGGIKSLDTISKILKFQKLSSLSTRLSGLSRWSGRLGVGVTLLASGFVVGQYYRGDLTDRQFTQILSPMGGGVLGGLGGGWGGAALGSWVGFMCGGPFGAGIGGTIGAILGGFGGGYAGSSLVAYGVNTYYAIKDQSMEAERVKAIYAHYGLP